MLNEWERKVRESSAWSSGPFPSLFFFFDLAFAILTAAAFFFSSTCSSLCNCPFSQQMIEILFDSQCRTDRCSAFFGHSSALFPLFFHAM